MEAQKGTAMHAYLEPTDADAFVDHPVQDMDDAAKCGMNILCPQCKGHGGWNLRLNAYPLHEHADTPENRHRYSHFRAHCTQCQGYGYVTEDNADHIHEWVRIKTIGNCLNLHECRICKRQWEVDSSG
jgi:hypothetical protein